MSVIARLLRAGLHLAAACAISGLVYPFASRGLRATLQRRWSRELLAILGVRLRASARPPVATGLLVANHVSWLDIVAIHAIAPSAFVCKAEVARWPVLGWLVGRQGTVFLHRGSARAARRTLEVVRERLAAGERIVLFPEGTTSDGADVLDFRPALFQAAVDCGALVQPLALSYSSPVAAFLGEQSLWQSLRAVASAKDLEIEVRICTPLASGRRDRRSLAAAARRAIQTRLAGGSRRPGVRGEGATAPTGSGSAEGTLPSSTAQIRASRLAVSRA